MSSSVLLSEINSLSPELRREVEHFVEFLKTKMHKQPILEQREYGYAQGKVKLNKDFDEPLEEFDEYR